MSQRAAIAASTAAAAAFFLGTATGEAQQSFSDGAGQMPAASAAPFGVPPPIPGQSGAPVQGFPGQMAPAGADPSAPGQSGQMQPFPGQGGFQVQQPQLQNPPAATPESGTGPLDQLAAMERQDFGVPPQRELHAGAFHGPTPNQIPGGQVITTKGLVELVRNQQVPKAIFDVLGAAEKLPGAVAAVPASQPGTFQDATQQQLGQYLQNLTRGNREAVLVFYCQNVQCWMSYNASLRAIALGYTNVLWYRGGLEAWKSAGLPTEPQA